MKKASGRLLFLVSYLAYASLYIARLNLTVASPVMQEEQLMSASQIGIMGGGFFLFYSAGQLLNGFLGDIFPPKLMVMSGLFLTAASNLGIGFLPDSRIIILLWGINGFAQSMLWGPLLRSIAACFPPRRKSFYPGFLGGHRKYPGRISCYSRDTFRNHPGCLFMARISGPAGIFCRAVPIFLRPPRFFPREGKYLRSSFHTEPLTAAGRGYVPWCP